MKAKSIVAMIFVMIIAQVNAVPVLHLKNQEKTKTITGVFDSYDESDGYIFLITDEEDGKEKYIYFNHITDKALESVNLKLKSFEGQTFQITYRIEDKVEVDDNGMEDTYEIFTITALKKI